MSALKLQLTEDMKTAMRAHAMDDLGTIRYLLSEIKNREIDDGELSDEQVQAIIRSQIKKMQEAIVDFERGSRQDLVDAESKKIVLLEKYLPAQLPEAELEEIVRQVIAETGLSAVGPLTGQVMKRVQGRADGKRVGAVLQRLLAA